MSGPAFLLLTAAGVAALGVHGGARLRVDTVRATPLLAYALVAAPPATAAAGLVAACATRALGSRPSWRHPASALFASVTALVLPGPVALLLALAFSTVLDGSWSPRAIDARLRALRPIDAAVVLTSLVAAWCASEFGAATALLPLAFLLPLYVRPGADGRHAGAAVLGRLTDAAGCTAPGHARRVAALSVAVGTELGLPPGDLDVLERAALLHGVGRVGGENSPRGRARLSAGVAREAGQPGRVVQIVELHGEPRRPGPVPVESRILRAVSAYEDGELAAGAPADYDPWVVEALAHVVERAGADRPAGAAVGFHRHRRAPRPS